MKPYKPLSLPLDSIIWEDIVSLIANANRAIARYDGILRSIHNPEMLLSPLADYEAVTSSRIEGTQTTLNELHRYISVKDEKKYNADAQEVLNYKIALQRAISMMKEENLPLSLRVIRETHKTLMKGVRGESSNPGNYRKVQNWIGPPNATQENARFVPPSPQDIIPALDNLEKYIHFDEKDILVQLAIIHAQFEIIHPFIDGNGRIGRLLIPLFLYEKQIISKPIFYISSYLEYDRNTYYDKLRDITDTNNWMSWIHFFLNTILNQSNIQFEIVNKIQNLYDSLKEKISKTINSSHILPTLEFIFSKPIFTMPEFVQNSKIPKSSASRILNDLVTIKVLIYYQGKGNKAGFYHFDNLYEITNRSI